MPQCETREKLLNRADWVDSRVSIRSERDTKLYLHQVRSRGKSNTAEKAPVILAHGTFSNHRTCGGLARYLAGLGHDCWLIDYEGHGSSEVSQPSASFESLFLSGTPVAVDYVRQRTGQNPHWIGHSGGGLAALMSVARKPELSKQLRSLVMLGSQACHAGHRLTNRLMLHICKMLTEIMGAVPGKKLGIGPENEEASVMLQWYRWNLETRWAGDDEFDYLQALSHHEQLASLPVLAVAGSGDWFIAPPSACKRLHSLIPGTANKWLECGRANGYSENFSHARLISSRAAAREIWPQVATWIANAEKPLRDP